MPRLLAGRKLNTTSRDPSARSNMILRRRTGATRNGEARTANTKHTYSIPSPPCQAAIPVKATDKGAKIAAYRPAVQALCASLAPRMLVIRFQSSCAVISPLSA